MGTSRVLIHYKPQLYTDLFARIFQSIGSVELYDPNSPVLKTFNGKAPPEIVDVVVFSLDVGDQPGFKSLPEWFHSVKLLTFSPTGDVGYRRLPGEENWEEIQPFGMDQLIHEIVGSQALVEDAD